MMKIQFPILILLILVLAIVYCNDKDDFYIQNHSNEIRIDGVINEDEWPATNSIAGFRSPWSEENNDETIFKCFQNNDALYFYFEVFDTTLIIVNYVEELSVAEEDRVELFFSADTSLSNYYCIEVDPLGRILDYSAKFYRIFDERWDFEQKRIVAKIHDSGYVVEGRISIKELHELGLGNEFYLGIFRADFKSNNLDDVVWYSWIKPKSEEPDFHIPSALGICRIE